MHRINADKLSQFTDKLILADIIPEVAVLKLSELSLLRIITAVFQYKSKLRCWYNGCLGTVVMSFVHAECR